MTNVLRWVVVAMHIGHGLIHGLDDVVYNVPCADGTADRVPVSLP